MHIAGLRDHTFPFFIFSVERQGGKEGGEREGVTEELTNDAIKVVPTFEEGFLEDEVVDVEPAGEAGVVVGEADIPGLLQREQLLHLGGKTCQM